MLYIQNPCNKVGTWTWTEVRTSDFIVQKFGLVVEKKKKKNFHIPQCLIVTCIYLPPSDLIWHFLRWRWDTVLSSELSGLYKVLYSLPCQIVSVSYILLDKVQILLERKYSAHGSLPLPAELRLLQSFMLSLNRRGNLCPQITAQFFGHGSVLSAKRQTLDDKETGIFLQWGHS